MLLKTIKIGAISLCLMTLNACSTKPVSPPILCPQTATCGDVSLHIHTNKDLAQALLKTHNMLQFCLLENNALKNCIDDFNKREVKR
ncbi:Rz1-like lysis system protein LysC [Pasteurella sp. PK-2025]|uniref:Rz1-like lysis system protein LysC n=1 Tax=Pasteurella sp. PK-2025 TaxID=3413133 RepID=UPI003C74A81E